MENVNKKTTEELRSIIKQVKEDSVRCENITLCTSGKFSEVNVDENDWGDAAKKVITSCRQNNSNEDENK